MKFVTLCHRELLKSFYNVFFYVETNATEITRISDLFLIRMLIRAIKTNGENKLHCIIHSSSTDTELQLQIGRANLCSPLVLQVTASNKALLAKRVFAL